MREFYERSDVAPAALKELRYVELRPEMDCIHIQTRDLQSISPLSAQSHSLPALTFVAIDLPSICPPSLDSAWRLRLRPGK